MDYMKKNLLSIQENHPSLYNALSTEPNTSGEFMFNTISAKDGTLITQLVKNNKTVNMNSPYKPLGEAKHFSAQYTDIIDFSVILFLGFGNGIIPRQIKTVLPAHCSIIFYEPSVELFRHTLSNFDISDILETENIHIIVEGLNDNETSRLFRRIINASNYLHTYYDALPKFKTLFPDQFNSLMKQYEMVISGCKASINTSRIYNRNEAENHIYNLRHTFMCNCAEQYIGNFPTDLPVVIVAAGPSLEKNGELLKQVKNKLMIIAVDASLPYLLNHDIMPDLVLIADPMKELALFENNKAKTLTFAIDSAASYRCVNMVEGRKFIFIESSSSYYKNVFRLGGFNIDILENGGSVSTLAVSLAAYWGYTKFVLVGQDLAYGDNQMYAGRDINPAADSRARIPVEGYFGETVYTVDDFKYYLDWYESIIKEYPQLTIINSTEGGAMIHGAVQLSLHEIINEFCYEDHNYESIICNMPPAIPENKLHELYMLISNSTANLEKIKDSLTQGLELVDSESKLLHSNSHNNIGIQKAHKRISQLIESCYNYDEILFVEQVIEDRQSNVLSDIYDSSDDPNEEHTRILAKLCDYINDMISATEDVKQIFTETIKLIDSNMT